MGDVLRFDRGEFRRAVRLDNGVLRVDAVPTKAGVFAYRNADGTMRRELRLPEEVFHADSLATLEGSVITLGHPETGTVAGRVRDLQRGHLGTDVSRDGNLVRASAFVTDSEAQQAAETGKARELSCGYRCRVDHEPGRHPVYGEYTHVQRRIRYDHVALVSHGRAGESARLHLDSADDTAAEMVLDEEPAADTPPTPPADGGQRRNDSMDPKLITIRLDGVDYQLTEQAAQAVQKMQARQDEQVTALTKERDEAKKALDKEKARADAADEKLEEANKRLDEATTPEALRAAIQARLDLERKAGELLGEEKAGELKIDQMDDLAIQKAVVAHLSPAAKARIDADDASADYIAARFDQAVDQAAASQKPHPNLGATRQRADAAAGASTGGDARQRMIDAQRKRFKGIGSDDK